MLVWFLRRGLWDLIALLKFTSSKPLNIPLPQSKQHVIEPKPMIEAIAEVPLRNVMVCPRTNIPKDERSWLHTKFYEFQVYSVVSPSTRAAVALRTDCILADHERSSSRGA